MLGLRASGRSRGYLAPGGERGVGGWGWIRGGVVRLGWRGLESMVKGVGQRQCRYFVCFLC